MSDDLNKLDLLIKIMRMTESDNENMQLVALRKANSLLKEEKWDWERLLRGKVKLIADPFASQPKAPAPQARPATMTKPASPPPPPPPTYAPNVWPQGQRPAAPTPKPASPKPSTPPPPRVAPAGPLHFRRASTGEWAIASYRRLNNIAGVVVTLEKRNGDKSQETVGPFIEQDQSGHYLYKIAKAGKWKSKFADTSDVGDII